MHVTLSVTFISKDLFEFRVSYHFPTRYSHSFLFTQIYILKITNNMNFYIFNIYFGSC